VQAAVGQLRVIAIAGEVHELVSIQVEEGVVG
jgi:hypothetical protein